MNSSLIDTIVFKAVFSSNNKEKLFSREKIRKLAKKSGIFLASICKLYSAIGKNKIGGFTVPAINLRFLTYDTARVIFRLVKKLNIGPFVFEIARSEQRYTEQRPDEYAVVILAAALAENYRGPVFLQGDHYQFSRPHFQADPKSEIDSLKKLIRESIEAGFYNIDIDASTLVDLARRDLDDQQFDNYMMTALMTKTIRDIEPTLKQNKFATGQEKMTVSVGGEIGHIGGKNSTVEEFEAFMKGFNHVMLNSFQHPNKIPKQVRDDKLKGISKISVQTGTSHGGMPLPNGKMADIKLDFAVLKEIGKAAREKYGLGGVVQHGASTLPGQLFDRFPKLGVLEVHLATGFQNIVFDYLPKKIKEEIYFWLKKEHKNEWKENLSENQFIYKTRKKAAGPFKKRLWQMTEQEKKPILTNLEKRFQLLFEKLRVINTKKVVEKFV